MRSFLATSTCSFVALAIAAPALAGEIDAASKIDSVTVYPDAAIISRIAEIDLPAGDNTLIFKSLPLTLDPASLRLEGEGSAKVTIGAVDSQVDPAETASPDNAIDAKLTSLRSEREGWQSTIDALNAKRAMIVRFSQSGPEKLSAEAKPLDVGQWNAAWDTVAVGRSSPRASQGPPARRPDQSAGGAARASAAGPGRAAKRNRDDQRGGADACAYQTVLPCERSRLAPRL
jgi:hypothetical protein